MEQYQYSFFDKANAFLEKVRFIESIRKRLSPKTITTIKEIGSIIGSQTGDDIPPEYWGYPSQFPDVSMMDWKNGNPNARYWILKLVKDDFGPGDKLVATSSKGNFICQAFITAKGKKILLINPHNKEVTVNLPEETKDAVAEFVDVSTGENPPGQLQLQENRITLKPFGVAVVGLK